MQNKKFILTTSSLIITALCHCNPVIAGYDGADSENNPVSTISIKQISSKEGECFEEQTSTKNFIRATHKSTPIIYEALESFASVRRAISTSHSNLFLFLIFTFFQVCQGQGGNGHGDGPK